VGTEEEQRQDELAAFERFFDGCSRALVGQAYVLTGDRQEAQDLAQEALARVWDRWPVVSQFDDPTAWARRVLFNLAMSRLRRRRLERRRPPEAVLAAPAPSADAVDLARALRRLPVAQRKALVLREVLGLDIEEVAQEMRASEGTVRKWLHRARRTLAAELAADDVYRPPSTARLAAPGVRHV
jgi:RNA polymerase sigma-70 factor (ECF subfamily)